jgi:hypothetical protein
MFKRHNLRHLFATLLFLACQWLLVVHATEHALKAGPDVACEICSVANAASTAPDTFHVPDAAPLESFEPALSVSAAPTTAQLRLPPSCGPPLHLA